MARIKDQRNTWGAAGDAPNPQRADLWQIDLTAVVNGLNTEIAAAVDSGLDFLPATSRFYAQAVSLPELKVGTGEYRRDSRPYLMPVFDEPLGAFTVKFLMDSPTDSTQSRVYRLLDTWRAAVRAGRGPMKDEPSFTLNADFRIEYAFTVGVSLLRGATNLQILDLASEPGVTNDLEVCGEYTLDDVWLSSFKVSELNYTAGNQLVVVEAQLVAGNLTDISL